MKRSRSSICGPVRNFRSATSRARARCLSRSFKAAQSFVTGTNPFQRSSTSYRKKGGWHTSRPTTWRTLGGRLQSSLKAGWRTGTDIVYPSTGTTSGHGCWRFGTGPSFDAPRSQCHSVPRLPSHENTRAGNLETDTRIGHYPNRSGTPIELSELRRLGSSLPDRVES